MCSLYLCVLLRRLNLELFGLIQRVRKSSFKILNLFYNVGVFRVEQSLYLTDWYWWMVRLPVKNVFLTVTLNNILVQRVPVVSTRDVNSILEYTILTLLKYPNTLV